MTDQDVSAVLAALALIHQRLGRIEAAVAGDVPTCRLTKALADTVGMETFTASEVMMEADRAASVASALGLRPDGLTEALAAEGIKTPQGFGRWTASAPGIERATRDRG
jgi:hypothetical protein